MDLLEKEAATRKRYRDHIDHIPGGARLAEIRSQMSFPDTIGQAWNTGKEETLDQG